MVHTRRRPGRPRSAEADAAILDAALDLLIERGAAATSIEQVAQRAGVTRATIYRRFPGKTELLSSALLASWGNPPETPEIPDVEQMLTGTAYILSQPRQRRLLRRLYASIDDYPELKQLYSESYLPHWEQARRVALEQGRDRGQFPPDANADVILQVLTGAVWHHLATYPDTTSTQEVRAFLTAVLQQTGYRPAGDVTGSSSPPGRWASPCSCRTSTR
jgi:AcrR family transcriptional regulator